MSEEPKYIFTTPEAAENMAEKLGCSGHQEFYNIDGKQSGLKANTTYYLPCSSRDVLHNRLDDYKEKMAKSEELDLDQIDFAESEVQVSFDAFLQSYFANGSDSVSDSVRKTLSKKAAEYNKNTKHKIKTATLITVFRRGVGAYKTNPTSVRPNVRGPEQWGYGRVNGFLHALGTGSFKRKPFDTDLLPSSHRLSSKNKKK
jgi:hypothetical protein